MMQTQDYRFPGLESRGCRPWGPAQIGPSVRWALDTIAEAARLRRETRRLGENRARGAPAAAERVKSGMAAINVRIRADMSHVPAGVDMDAYLGSVAIFTQYSYSVEPDLTSGA